MKKERFYFVDLLRGLALAVMIEVHVTNALIAPALQSAWWFPIVNFFNGLVAPSFIFISGFAFTISFSGMINSPGINVITKRTGRILLILIVGYTIHTPSFSFNYLINSADDLHLRNFFNVDVLQCIALGLFILLGARIAIRSEKIFRLFSLAAGIAVVSASPFIWHIDFSAYMPLMAASYFNEINGSFFPFFPWAGFMFSGSFIASLYLKARESSREDQFMKRLAVTGTAAAAAGFGVVFYLSSLGGFEVRPSPFFFFERLGFVLMLLWLCRILCKKRDLTNSMFLTVSRESLPVYWLHLQLIYRKIYCGRSLNDIYGSQLGVMECLVISIILMLLMAAFAIFWSALKKKYPEVVSLAFRCFMIIAILIFLII